MQSFKARLRLHDERSMIHIRIPETDSTFLLLLRLAVKRDEGVNTWCRGVLTYVDDYLIRTFQY